MRLTRFALCGMMTLTAASLCATARAEAPTTQQIQDDYDSKQYQNVIRDVAQAMPLTADPSKGYDKATLLALKAESHLQLKQYAPAADAYNSAAKDSSDPQMATIYKALSLLIHKSPGGSYQPRQPTTRPVDANGKPTPINIIDMNQRGEAMNALLADETKVVSAKIEPLTKQNTLPPLMEGIKQIGDLRAIEMAATGKDEASKQLVGSLADHAAELMSNAIKTMSANVDEIQKHADESTSSGMYNVTTRAGLTSTDRNTLNEIINTAKNISSACDQFTAAIKTPSSGFDGVKKDADALSKHAADVINEENNGTTTTTTPPPPGNQPPHRPRMGY